MAVKRPQETPEESFYDRLPAPSSGEGGRQPLDTRTPKAQAKGVLLPPRATADGTLRRLQEAALIGFGDRGYHGVSTRELAEATGVVVSSVYAHVNAKEDLLHELCLMGHQEHNEELHSAVDANDADPAMRMR